MKQKTKQPNPIRTRLSIADHARFNEMCKLEGKTQTELARQAIVEMLDRQEKGTQAEIKDKLAERLKKMEDRMAALLARNNLDIGIVYQLMWLRSDPEKREALFAAARKHAAQRSSRALAEGDLEIKNAIKGNLQAGEE